MIRPTPKIVQLTQKKLVGKRLFMSFANNKTAELWRSFMPERKQILNTLTNQLYSLQDYPFNFFSEFSPETVFEKWAAIEVTDFENLPQDMESLLLPAGLYAVFQYKGKPEEATDFFNYIFQEWLPASEYLLDERPHFEVLGEKYRNDSPDSEEEVWIPVRNKG
ncbi:GyrI-like domain-containing protein [Flavobacterium sp. SM15]|uniref:GyrI-like domain-containing protein n=1 Tax=Flavobacterium sp. SM15 TaxID=2908005 RepID=UPI001ED9CF6E|nr:GyrI-like domain-containing protein [Flavobacterium sp. SM15]MCG2612219.1 GyrI-like domain-containing protein [Flavobacterium sp. SM15]